MSLPSNFNAAEASNERIQRNKDLDNGPRTVAKIHKYELIEDLGDGGGWGIWKCEIEMSDGSIYEGSVQGDEYSTAEETLEFDEPEESENEDGPTDEQQELSRAGHEASEARYRQQMQDAGRGHLLP